MRGHLRSPGRDVRSAPGQALVLVCLALPLFFTVMAFAVDGSTLMVHHRSVQNAADAAALAVAQSIDISKQYAQTNGVDVAATWHRCADPDPSHPTDTNCYAYPYVNRADVGHPHF